MFAYSVSQDKIQFCLCTGLQLQSSQCHQQCWGSTPDIWTWNHVSIRNLVLHLKFWTTSCYHDTGRKTSFSAQCLTCLALWTENTVQASFNTDMYFLLLKQQKLSTTMQCTVCICENKIITSKFPSKLRISSDAGQSGLLTVDKRS